MRYGHDLCSAKMTINALQHRLPGSILRGDGSLRFRTLLFFRTLLTMIGSLQHLITGDLICSNLCCIWKYCETQKSPMKLLFLENINLQLYITKVLLLQFDIFFTGIPGFLSSGAFKKLMQENTLVVWYKKVSFVIGKLWPKVAISSDDFHYSPGKCFNVSDESKGGRRDLWLSQCGR